MVTNIVIAGIVASCGCLTGERDRERAGAMLGSGVLEAFKVVSVDANWAINAFK